MFSLFTQVLKALQGQGPFDLVPHSRMHFIRWVWNLQFNLLILAYLVLTCPLCELVFKPFLVF